MNPWSKRPVESLSPSLLSGKLGATHGRPEAVRKHAPRARSLAQGSAEVAGQAGVGEA